MANKGDAKPLEGEIVKVGSKRSKDNSKSNNKKGFFARRMLTVGWVSIIESVVVGILGGILIANPSGVLKVVFYIVGLFLMVKGIYKIVNFFAVHGRNDFYNNDLLYGVIALVFGVLSVMLWEQLSGAIGLIVGAWMIYGSLVRLNTAIKMNTAGIKEWFYVLILSMILLGLGIYVIMNIGGAPTLIGWIMIATAVVGIADDIVFMRHIDAIKTN